MAVRKPAKKRGTASPSQDLISKVSQAMKEFKVVDRPTSTRGVVPALQDVHVAIIGTFPKAGSEGLPPQQVTVPWKPGEDPRELIKSIRGVIRRNGHKDMSIFSRREHDHVLFWAGPAVKRKKGAPAPAGA